MNKCEGYSNYFRGRRGDFQELRPCPFFGLLWSVELSWHLWVCHLAYENILQGAYNEAWVSLVAQMVKQLPAMQETWVRSLGWKYPWRRKWQPTLVFLPGEFHGQRSLVGYRPYGSKESNTTEQLILSLILLKHFLVEPEQLLI